MKNLLKRLAAFFLVFGLAASTSTVKAASADNYISARAYILLEATTGRVIEAKNENQRLPIASTTKIMTAMLTLEQENLDELFVVDSNAIKVEGSSMGLREGDSVSLFALSNGMLLSSGNDSANAAAVKISGSIEKFAEKMNGRARSLNMENTSFVTPSGLHDENHYSTCYDMGVLTREALKNDRFVEISSKKKAQVFFGAPPYKRYLFNHNRLVSEYDGCIGVKTGFTKNAGRCLVSAAKRDGVTLICVTLDASNDWADHTKLLNRGFEQVKPIEIVPSYEDIRLNLVGSDKSEIAVVPNGKTYGCVTPDMKLIQEVYSDKFHYAPIEKGDIMGEIRHIYNGEIIAVTDLVAAEDIPYVRTKNKNSIFGKFINHIKQYFK